MAFADANSPQGRRLAELQPVSVSTAKTILPDAPPPLQAVFAMAGAMVTVESEFNPNKVGGIPVIGVLTKGDIKVLTFSH